MTPLSILGMRTHFIQDLMTELPTTTASAQDFRLVASKFDPGMFGPLTVVLEGDSDFRRSEGLALIDDVSRLLSHQRQLGEVRSATQPLGSPHPLDRARLASRLGEVNAGFHQLAEGADLARKNDRALDYGKGRGISNSQSRRRRGEGPFARVAGLGNEAGIGNLASQSGGACHDGPATLE
jgi:uncharacterized membrane protein YdfJ with MMPL/SSD domain